MFFCCVCFSICQPVQPSTHPFIRPSCKSSSVSFCVVVEREAVSMNLQSEGCKDLTPFFSYLPEKQRRLYSLQLLSHVCPSSSFFFILVLSSPAFQRPEDNGAAHDAIVLPLSFVGGDLKFCFKTATSPILLNPPSSSSSCLPPSS